MHTIYPLIPTTYHYLKYFNQKILSAKNIEGELMKIELQINEELDELTILIQAPKLTEDIQQILQQQKRNLFVSGPKKVMSPLDAIYLMRIVTLSD